MTDRTPPVRVALEPVTGEIVAAPQATSQLQFGLRTLFMAMAVCSVQCALMSYLGVLAGLATGAVVSFLALSVLLCGGMVFSAAGAARQAERLDCLVVWLMMAIVALVLGTLLAGGGTAIIEVLAISRLHAWIQSDVGLSLQPTYVIDGDEPLLSEQVLFVLPGSVADRAGIRRGEVIIWDGERADFTRMLDQNRGKDVDLTVTTLPLNAAGQPTNKRNVTLTVPP